MNSQTVLSVENISKKYRQGETDVEALKQVSLNLEKGGTLALVGPSGSGKTTLLSLLAGLDEPSSGRICMTGQEITAMNEVELCEFRAKTMGIVFQQFHLMPYLSAFENVCLPLEINGEENIEERTRQILNEVGLEGRYHHRPDQLSGGECQRVAIARALVIQPSILLADEPSGNLDTKTGEIIMDLLFTLVKKRQMTLVLVTHDLEHARRCQKIIELKAGQVQ